MLKVRSYLLYRHSPLVNRAAPPQFHCLLVCEDREKDYHDDVGNPECHEGQNQIECHQGQTAGSLLQVQVPESAPQDVERCCQQWRFDPLTGPNKIVWINNTLPTSNPILRHFRIRAAACRTVLPACRHHVSAGGAVADEFRSATSAVYITVVICKSTSWTDHLELPF